MQHHWNRQEPLLIVRYRASQNSVLKADERSFEHMFHGISGVTSNTRARMQIKSMRLYLLVEPHGSFNERLSTFL